MNPALYEWMYHLGALRQPVPGIRTRHCCSTSPPLTILTSASISIMQFGRQRNTSLTQNTGRKKGIGAHSLLPIHPFRLLDDLWLWPKGSRPIMELAIRRTCGEQFKDALRRVPASSGGGISGASSLARVSFMSRQALLFRTRHHI